MSKEKKTPKQRLQESLQQYLAIPACNRTKADNKIINDLRKAILEIKEKVNHE
jgi:hypothetical protein